MGPPVVELTAHAVVAETVVFRIVRGASPQDPEVVAGFHSNYHRGFDPRVLRSRTRWSTWDSRRIAPPSVQPRSPDAGHGSAIT